MTGSVA